MGTTRDKKSTQTGRTTRKSGGPRRRTTAKAAAPSRKSTSSRVRKTVAKRAERPTSAPAAVSSEERHKMIAEAAYFRAARRGFAEGTPDQDWLAAEAEIDDLLRRPGDGRD